VSTKICSECKVEKSFSEFYKNSHTKKGFSNRCKVCDGRKNKAWKDANREKVRTAKRLWIEANPEKVAYQNRKNRYGHCINFEKIMKRYDEATNCECCGAAFTDTQRNMKCIDHSDDLIRGIICNNCNRGLGLLGDNLEGVKNATIYLERVV